MKKRSISVYLPPDLQALVQRVAKEQHRSDSSVISEAVKLRYALNEAAYAALAESARRQMGRIDQKFNKVIGEQLILKEMLLLFIRVWLEYNPPIEEEFAEGAAASAEMRFERFLKLLSNGLLMGRSHAEQEAALHAPNPRPPYRDGAEAMASGLEAHGADKPAPSDADQDNGTEAGEEARA